jgi:hypothetical protein
VQSERSDDKFCDDIFGETPTGVRKSVSLSPIVAHLVGYIFAWLLVESLGYCSIQPVQCKHNHFPLNFFALNTVLI